MESVSAAFAIVPGRSGMIIAVVPGIPAAQAGAWNAREGMEGLGGGKPVAGANSSAVANEVRQRRAFKPGPIVAPPGYPNEWAEVVIQTHLFTSGSEDNTYAIATTP